MKKFLSMFGLDKHHKIERFGVLFVVLTIAMSILIGDITVRNIEAKKDSFASKAKYTNTFTTSVSEVPGTVEGVWTSTDKTRSFILCKASDMNKLTRDANLYRVIMVKSDYNLNESYLDHSPTGMLYVYGNSGYFGIYMTDSQTFDDSIYRMTVRSYKELGSTNALQTLSKDSYDYDQFTLYINPVAEDATTLDALENNNINPEDLFKDCYADKLSEEVYNKYHALVANMDALMSNIEEFENRVIEDDVLLENRPSAISNEVITASIDDKELVRKLGVWYDDNGAKNIFNSNVDLVYSTDYVFDGGFMLDWNNTNAKDGYINTVTDLPYNKFVKSLDQKLAYTTEKIEWYYNDGTRVGATDTAYSDVTTLQNYYEQYINLKKDYQYNYPREVFKSEASMLDVIKNVSVNSSPNLFITR